MPILWNIQVSRDTNRSVQLYLLRRGKVHESDLSQFVEQAVRSRLFELLVEEKKAATHGKGPTGGNNER